MSLFKRNGLAYPSRSSPSRGHVSLSVTAVIDCLGLLVGVQLAISDSRRGGLSPGGPPS
jgi:hypothetical protein